MAQPAATTLEPRFESRGALQIAGLARHFTPATRGELPALWQHFAPYIGKVPDEISGRAYGAVTLTADGFDYLAGVEVGDISRLPDGFTCVRFPEQSYAVFRHAAHVSKLFDTMKAIEQWLASSGHAPARSAGAPNFFERYGPEFDPATGFGGIEVWVPIKR